jgi:hypothetical protein
MATQGLSRDLRQQDTQMPAGPIPVVPPGLYGGDRIVAGARFLSHLDPGWWRKGALLPASLTALDIADPYRCVLAWWAAQHLPAPPRCGKRQPPPYDRAMRALGLSSQQAQALGFTGVDADLLTPGWRSLITYMRATHDRRAAVDPERLPGGRHPPPRAVARAGHERGFSRKPTPECSRTVRHTWMRTAWRGMGSLLPKSRIRT